MVGDENDHTLGLVERKTMEHFIHCLVMVEKLVIAPHVENELFVNYGTRPDECLHKLEQQLCWGSNALHRFQDEMEHQKVVSTDLGSRSHLKLPLNFNGTVKPGFHQRRLQGDRFCTCF